MIRIIMGKYLYKQQIINQPSSYSSLVRALNWLNCVICIPRKKGLIPYSYIVSLGFPMVDPPVAKLAPCRKFVPSEFKYAPKYGNFTLSAAKWTKFCKSSFIFFKDNTEKSKKRRKRREIKIDTNEVYDKTTIRISTSWLVKEPLSVWNSNWLKCSWNATSIRIWVPKIVNCRELTRWQFISDNTHPQAAPCE